MICYMSYRGLTMRVRYNHCNVHPVCFIGDTQSLRAYCFSALFSLLFLSDRYCGYLMLSVLTIHSGCIRGKNILATFNVSDLVEGRQQQQQVAPSHSGGRRPSWTTEEIFIARGFRRESTTEDMMRCRNFRRQSQQVTNDVVFTKEYHRRYLL